MGTSLTGLTPATTYDALIKVGDNGPLSATAKVLSDGLGNDSKLNLSTASVGIGTSNPPTIFGVEDTNANVAVVNVIGTSPNYIFDVRDDGTSVFRVAGSGNVGIGTTTPASRFHVAGADAWMTLQRTSGTTNILDFTDSASVRLGYVGFISSNLTINAKVGSDIIFAPNNAERGRFTSNGLTFNGDTAAANALDDYEEGTWTMGISFGGTSTGITYSINSGSYTKIGRQVTLNGYLVLSNKGSSTGTARITGLPFTIGNANDNYSPPTLRLDKITFADQFQGFGGINTTTIDLEEITLSGTRTKLSDADFANDSSLIISFTYFV